VVVEEFKLFVNGGVTIAIAIHRMAEDGDTPLGIDHGGDADLNHAAIAEIALGDVCRGQQTVAGQRALVRIQRIVARGPSNGILVGAAEGEIGGVEVKALQGKVGEFQGAQGGIGHDGMAFSEEGVQGAAQAIIVEFFGWDVPENIGCVFVGPMGYVNQGVGLTEAGGEQQAEDLAMRKLQPWIRDEMLIDDGGDAELLKQWGYQSQGSEVQGGIVGMGSQKGKGHSFSAALEEWDDQPDGLRSKGASSLCRVGQGPRKIKRRAPCELQDAYNLATGSSPAAGSLKNDPRNMGLAKKRLLR
jgi:hypothetical protein